MIPELTRFVILAALAICALLPLAESETLAEWSERRHVNKMADRSRRRKAPTMRAKCQWGGAVIGRHNA